MDDVPKTITPPKKPTHRLKGKKVLTAVLVAMVAAVVLIAGVRIHTVMHESRTTSEISKLAATTSPSLSSRPVVTDETAYLNIPELGINIPLSAKIKDLVYTYTPGTSDSPGSLNFSTTSLSSTPGGSYCTPVNDPVGAYTVYATDQSMAGDTVEVTGQLVADVNGSKIYYKGAQYDCASTESSSLAVSALIDPIYAAIQKAKLATD
jgi:hypothetical protein